LPASHSMQTPFLTGTYLARSEWDCTTQGPAPGHWITGRENGVCLFSAEPSP
jgi:hypothetical protein